MIFVLYFCTISLNNYLFILIFIIHLFILLFVAHNCFNCILCTVLFIFLKLYSIYAYMCIYIYIYILYIRENVHQVGSISFKYNF